MKKTSITVGWLAVLMALMLAGCESVRHDFAAGVSEKFTRPVYSQRSVQADPNRVFTAAKQVIEEQGFRVTRSGAAQGVIEGTSGLVSDSRLRGSRQLTVKVRLAPLLEGGTEVAVLFTEMVEEDFNKGAGIGGERSLRNDPIYELFFARLNAVLSRGE